VVERHDHRRRGVNHAQRVDSLASWRRCLWVGFVLGSGGPAKARNAKAGQNERKSSHCVTSALCFHALVYPADDHLILNDRHARVQRKACFTACRLEEL
jgi:hypothetical protein